MLRDVRTVDENGQNLLFYPQKKEELQCVVSGEAVPVAAKGVFTFSQNAFANGSTVRPAVGDWVVPATNGLLTGVGTVALKTTYTNFKVGTVLATGTRESTQDTDFATGFYAMVKIDL
jgi:archaeosine-15-forming tRNA-guanine transglycosylase